MSWWPAIVFGWPAVALAMALATVGVATRKWGVIIAALVVVAPFSFYLAATPRGAWFGLAIPLLLVGASIATRYRQTAGAWLSLAPIAVIVGWLAIIVAGE